MRCVRGLHGIEGAYGGGPSQPRHVVGDQIVPVGTRHEIFGGLEMLPLPYFQPAINLLDALEAGDAADLVEFLASRFDAPTMVTTDGAPIVSCVACYERAMQEELSARYDDGAWTWAQQREDAPSPYPTVLGSLQMDGIELRVTAMSEARFETLLADLEHIDSLSLTESERVPFD